jgi:hypothetical protein
MSLGLQFANQESLSPSRMDSKTVYWGTGEQIAALPTNSEVMVALCIETGGGFVENTLYVRSADKTTWFPVFAKHLHDLDTNAAGGRLAEILRANQKQTQQFKFHDIRQLKSSSKSAGSPVPAQVNLNQTSYMDYSTGNTPSDYTNFWTNEGLRIDLSQKFALSFKMQISHNADLVFRFGAGAFQAQTAISPSNMVWLEGCNGSGQNFVAGVSNGLAVTTQASATNMVPTPTNISRGHRLEFIPATKVIYTNTAGGLVELNTNVPSSSYIPTENTIKGGIQTTNTTPKSLFIWLAELTYEVGSGESWL